MISLYVGLGKKGEFSWTTYFENCRTNRNGTYSKCEMWNVKSIHENYVNFICEQKVCECIRWTWTHLFKKSNYVSHSHYSRVLIVTAMGADKWAKHEHFWDDSRNSHDANITS